MEAEYEGEARLVTDERSIAVRVHLSGNVEPFSGAYRWAGRIAPDPAARELASGRDRKVTLRTEADPSARATLGEQDPWGGCRVSGTGAPPFRVTTDPDELEPGVFT